MSYHRRYKLKDDRFGLLALTLREKVGLTQAEVASELGVSERTIRHWEGGTAYPASDNLKQLIVLYLHKGAFLHDNERNEIKLFWEQATESASRRKALFDERWLDELLTQRQIAVQQSQGNLSLASQTDWGEAIDVAAFYGRKQDLLTLREWVDHERCRVVMLLGMGGIGKTTLSIRFAQKMTTHFDVVFWRSLRNAPPLEELLANCIQTLSSQQSTPFLHNVEKNILLLIELLRKRRCLLVLDNVETLLQADSLDGGYRQGYDGYGMLIQRVAEMGHQSCLLLTSREMLTELEPLEGTHAAVRVLKLSGLKQLASQELLEDKDLFGTQQDWTQLVQHYSGNPLALKIVGATVRDLFGGDIATFVREGPMTLHTLQQLLGHQLSRLTALEQDIMYWLVIEREFVSLEILRDNLLITQSSQEVLSALKSLRRRCLIERGERGATFTLQPEVMEYIGTRLIEQVCEEILNGSLNVLITHALMKAQSNDDIRESQIRMIVQPVLKRLLAQAGDTQRAEQCLQLILHRLKEKPVALQGYGGGNLVNLLACLKGHLRNVNFSSLAIRQAYLQGIEAQEANFADTYITDTLFMEPIESIASMTLSPDGMYLAVGSFSGQIRLWRLSDRTPLLTLQGHRRMVWSLAFSSDSTILASGGYDTSVKLWEVQSGRCLRTLTGHEKWIRSTAFSPDGTLLVTGGDDGTIRVWDVHEGTCLRVLSGHTGIVWSVALSPNGLFLVTGGDDESIRVWNVREGICLDVLYGHTGMVMAIAFHPSGDMFASGGEDGYIHLWDMSNKQQKMTLQLKTTKAASIAFNIQGTLLASGSQNGEVEIWRIAEERGPYRLRMLPGHPIWVSVVAFGPDDLLATVSYGGKVKLWEMERGRCLGTLQGYSHVIRAIAFSPDGSLLAHGDDLGMLSLWDVHSGRCLHVFQALAGCIWSVNFSPDGRTIVTGGDDQRVKVWMIGSVQGEANDGCIRTLYGHKTMVWSVVFSPDGSLLASSGFDWTVNIWKVKEEKEETPFISLAGHTTFVWSIAFSVDGKTLASGDNDGIIKVWDCESGQCLLTLQNSLSPVGALIFSRDGETLLSSSSDGAIIMWSLRNGCIGKVVQEHGPVTWAKGITFSQDGDLLATSGDNSTIQVARVEEPTHANDVMTLTLPRGQVWSLAFSPDGRTLASGDDHGALMLWDREAGSCRQVLRSDRPYERMNIQGVKGINEAQRTSLKALGAIEAIE